MFDLNDLELERSGEAPPPPPPRSTNYALWTATIVAAIVVAGGVWYVTSKRQPSSPPVVNVPAPAPQATVPERPEGPLVQAADINLPPLAETDPIVRELVARLSSHPTIAAWLTTKGLIANFTVTTLTIAEGRTPVQLLRPLAPRGRFRTRRSGEELFVDPRSYERFNVHAVAISALDSVGTAILYLTLKPRISDVYRELGYPEGSTLFYPILLYYHGFRYFHMGYASAMAVLLLAVAFALTLVIIRGSRRFVHYQGAAR